MSLRQRDAAASQCRSVAVSQWLSCGGALWGTISVISLIISNVLEICVVEVETAGFASVSHAHSHKTKKKRRSGQVGNNKMAEQQPPAADYAIEELAEGVQAVNVNVPRELGGR
eukprot:g49061.t1